MNISIKMRRVVLLTVLLAFCSLSPAQTARQVLDATAAKLQKGGVQANFQATTFSGLTEKGSSKCTLQLQGSKFKITMDGMTTWYDGKTQWTMLSGSGEVNLSQPTTAEAARINPYSFINLYKSGYNVTLKNATYQGRPCYDVTLTATSRCAAFQRVLISIDKSYTPLNVRAKDAKGNWMRFRISSVQTGKHFNDATFRFDKKQYPDVEVIDLR